MNRLLTNRLLTFAIFACLTCCISRSVDAQTLTVDAFLKQEKEWDNWIRQKKHVHIDGRYAGRFSRQFRLEKLSVMMQPGRNVVLPARLDGGQRIAVSGYMQKTGSRYVVNVDRISVGSTDADRIRDRIRRLPKNDPQAAYELANKYEPNAVFYEDDELAAEIAKIRTDAFAVQRSLVNNDVTALRNLIAAGTKLGVAQDTLTAINFQATVALSKQPKVDTSKLIAEIKKLPDWDKFSTFLDLRTEADFLANPVSTYEAADKPNRLRMNRRYYRTIRLPQILKTAAADGSNGNKLASKIRSELPEELEEAKKQDNAYIQFQLSKVKSLTRRQLQDLDALLRRFDRGSEMEAALESWLIAQEQRLSNGQLDGMMSVAEEYLFAYDTWKKTKHKLVGSNNLKQAFNSTRTSAPKVAAEIEARLKTLDWIWLHDRWMSTEEANQLPDNDTEKAMIEGRVVRGMQASKVVELLGQPSRKIRVVSANGIHAIWIFGEVGSTATVVHLSRTKFQPSQDSKVTYVGVDRR